MPKVSVVIPTHNRAGFIADAVASVLAQTFADWDLFVVDDKSADETEQVMERFKDERITYIRHPVNRGAAAARNTGITASSGEYIAFLDSDDVWLPGKLEKQVALFDALPDEVGMIYGDFMLEYADGRSERYNFAGRRPLSGWVFTELINSFVIRTSTVMVKRDAIVGSGMFDETIRSGQDLDTFVSIAHDHAIHAMDEVVATLRAHGSNLHQDLTNAGPHQLAAAYKLRDKFNVPTRAMAKTLSRCHLHYGLYLLNRGEAREARKHFARVILLYPRRLSAWALLVLSLFGGRPFRAYRAIRRGRSRSRRYLSEQRT